MPTNAFLKVLEEVKVPKGHLSQRRLEGRNLEEPRRSRAVAFHLGSHFGAVGVKKAESACRVGVWETLTPVGLGGLVGGEREEKQEGKREERGEEKRAAVAATTEFYNLFPEPEVFPIHSDGEEDEAQPFGEEPRQAEPASGSAQPPGRKGAACETSSSSTCANASNGGRARGDSHPLQIVVPSMCCWKGAILLAPPRGPRLHSACDFG